MTVAISISGPRSIVAHNFFSILDAKLMEENLIVMHGVVLVGTISWGVSFQWIRYSYYIVYPGKFSCGQTRCW